MFTHTNLTTIPTVSLQDEESSHDIHPRFTLALIAIQEVFPDWHVSIADDMKDWPYTFPINKRLCGLLMRYKGVGAVSSDVIVRTIKALGVGLETGFNLNISSSDYKPQKIDEVYTVVDLCMKLL